MNKINGILMTYSDNLHSSVRFYEEAKKLDMNLYSYINQANSRDFLGLCVIQKVRCRY